ncbi:MAG: lysophospholipid acyltransferase family protein [Pyrinomonadaceae bacterium]
MRKILAAIRVTLFVVMTLGLYSAWFIASPFIPNGQMWRQIIFGLWGKGFVKIAGFKVEVVGTPPRPPFFLVSNHLTYADIPLLRSIFEGVFVAKGEIEGWFMAGRIVSDMGAIFINRQNRRDIPRAGAQILKSIENGEGVTVFPEGTSTKGEEVLRFNSSFLEFAAQSDLPVYYASINYKTPAGELPAHLAVAWWEDISFMAHMYRMFQVSGIEATVNFGEQPVQSNDRKELARTLWGKVSEDFIPLS